MICLDTETDGLELGNPIVSISFYDGGKHISYGILHPEATLTELEAKSKTQRIIDRCDVIINHNVKYDVCRLMKWGISFKHRPLLICTQILEWLKSGHRNKQTSLDEIAKKYLKMSKVEGLDFSKKLPSEYPLKQLLHYNDQDTLLPYKLYPHVVQGVSMELVKFYSDLIYFFCELELNGMCLDEDKLVCLHDSTLEELQFLESKMNALLEYPINTASGQQLGAALFGGIITYEAQELVSRPLKGGKFRIYTRKIDIPVQLNGLGFGTSKLKKTANGNWPTDNATMLSLKGRTKKAKEYIELYQRYNKVKAIYDKFFKSYINHDKFGFIHPTFNLSNTTTGRTSCSNPNVQQQKRPDDSLPNPKSVFKSRFENGVILDVDFSSAEWRLAANRSQDQVMIDEIVKGIDAHKAMATNPNVLGVPYEDVDKDTRQNMKSLNFGIIYGQSGYGFMKREDIPMIKSKKEGDTFVREFYKKYVGLKRMHDRDSAVARSKGKLVMPTGRVYDYSGDYYKETTVKNYPVQGASSDMVLACILECFKRLNSVLIINSVHDCIVCDCPSVESAMEAKEIIINIFTNAAKYVKVYFKEFDINVPIDAEAEMGNNWGEMKEI